MATNRTDVPPRMDHAPKALQKWAGIFNKLRDYAISGRVQGVNIRSGFDADEQPAAVLRSTINGLFIDLITGRELPTLPSDGEYLLWVKITDGVLDDGVDPNPAWFGPPGPSGTYVLGAIDGVIQWLETDTCPT